MTIIRSRGAAVLIGAASWTAAEYGLHRFLMHGLRGRGLASVEHLKHHADVTYFSPTFQRLLEHSGTRSSQLGFGVQATWPAGFRPVGVGIDQSIYKGPITVVARRRGPVLGSEHRVLIVTYALASP